MSKNTELISKSLEKRHRSEKRFRFFGILGIGTAVIFLITILSSIFVEGKGAFVGEVQKPKPKLVTTRS